jgi:hypothetical protein
MVSGIDEIGDFNPQSNEYNYFVATHIDQNGNKYLIKKKQFEAWEEKISMDQRNLKGEVKGNSLFDQQLISFYKEVIELEPRIIFSITRIKPNENPPELIEYYKSHFVAELERVIQQLEKERKLIILKSYQNILYWYKNRNFQQLLKIICLENLIGVSINIVIAYAQLRFLLDNNDDANIKNIAFKIDKDFVKAQNAKILWGEMFRQFWENYNKKCPIPAVNAWQRTDNPIYKIYGFEGKLNLLPILRNRTSFVDSEKNFEVQIADIFGTIIHRHQNHDRCNDIYQEIRKDLNNNNKRNFVHIKLEK